jgi:hypothetical protein
MSVCIVVDGCHHDRARFSLTEWHADADCMTHEDVARQRVLLGRGNDHVAQCTDAGIHTIRANAARDDLLDQFPRRSNPCARIGGKLDRLTGCNRCDLTPVERRIGTNHGHESALLGEVTRGDQIMLIG